MPEISTQTKDNILIVTLDRASQGNCVSIPMHTELDRIWSDFEDNAELRAAIITGSGKFFSTGADLKDWLRRIRNSESAAMPGSGFMGLSKRVTKKPIICAMNGPAYGGGVEALVNCDLVVACKQATLQLPEVRRGVTARAGALLRLARIVSHQRAVELACAGNIISADTAHSWGIVNAVVDSPDQVLTKALEYAANIAKGSPEAVEASLTSVRLSQRDVLEADGDMEEICSQVDTMDNVREGLAAFAEKREPKWTPAKL